MKVGDRTLDLSEPRVMTIINVTPDSFFADSRLSTCGDISSAISTAVDAGASILDVGGYSSRPGAEDVSWHEEFSRIAMALEVIKKKYPDAIVSLDTFRSEVARRCIDEFGPCIINDISAGELDPAMPDMAAAYRVPYIAMHMRSTPSDMQQYANYEDITAEVTEFFANKIIRLQRCGIKPENIILDPGFGFAKTTRQNYELLKSLHRLTELGFPILSGISRKSMIYKVLGVEPADALGGTIALNWESLRGGASILRVHDTKQAMEVVKLYNYYKNA